MNMKIIYKTFITVLLTSFLIKAEIVDQELIQKCPLTEYSKYVKCLKNIPYKKEVEERNETKTLIRKKEFDCNKCTCEICSSDDFADAAENNCCKECCPFVPCKTKHCCFKTCHSGCQTLECRFSCRQSCFKYIEKKNVTLKQLSVSQIYNDDNLNITTKINLTNTITNMNNISLPIRINSTNQNDIAVESRQKSESINTIANSPCCNFVTPTKCSAATKFPFVECDFNKTSQCGDVCLRKDLQKILRPPCNSIKSRCGVDSYLPMYLINSNETNSNLSSEYNNSNKTNTTSIISSNPLNYYSSPQQYFDPSSIQIVEYPPIYPPRNYYGPVNPFISVPNIVPQYVSNPSYSWNSYYQPPTIYSSLYNNVPYYYNSAPQIPYYSNYVRYQNPNYLFPSVQSYNYQLKNAMPTSNYQSSQMVFPSIYTSFIPKQSFQEIAPSPNILFRMESTRPKSDAQVLIEKENERKES
ncbi:hypothetical protein HHI36_000700 [Cryptolaemus montrouzieri]|uniref:Uncharacterized protein n=1 Tax=Cryptolaemus montrouzieri TaxID=559131 RepID=A0ABD2P597_9CUCU